MRLLLVVLAVLFTVACGRPLTTTEMRAKVAGNVAIVIIPGVGSGSGFVVKGKSGKKYVATNAHVCMKEGTVLHIQFRANGPKYVETAVEVNAAEDLCLVSLAEQSLNAFEVVNTANPGDHIYTAGHPLGKGLTVTEGDVVDSLTGYQVGGYPAEFCKDGVGEIVDTFFGSTCAIPHTAIDFNAAMYPGNSGGPLLNDKGQVVGIDFAGGELGGAALRTEPLKEILKKF